MHIYLIHANSRRCDKRRESKNMKLTAFIEVVLCHVMVVRYQRVSAVASAMYVARPQSKFPTRPTASKPYIARSDCAYVIEQ
jgi:hypothetical protein